MAEKPGVHHVFFSNETTETVTFIHELRSGPQTAFTLTPNGPSYRKEVQTPLTNEQLRLVVGGNSNGQYTNECVSTDELPGFVEVVVKFRNENAGNNVNNFVLEKKPKKPRRTNEGPSVTRSRLWWPWSRNEGTPLDRLGV